MVSLMQFRVSAEYLRRYKRKGMLKTMPLVLVGVGLGIWLHAQWETPGSSLSSAVVWVLPIVLFFFLYVYVRSTRRRMAWLSAYELHVGGDRLWVKGLRQTDVYAFLEVSQVIEQPDGTFLLFDNTAGRYLEIPAGIEPREQLRQFLSSLGVQGKELPTSEHLLHFGRPF